MCSNLRLRPRMLHRHTTNNSQNQSYKNMVRFRAGCPDKYFLPGESQEPVAPVAKKLSNCTRAFSFLGLLPRRCSLLNRSHDLTNRLSPPIRADNLFSFSIIPNLTILIFCRHLLITFLHDTKSSSSAEKVRAMTTQIMEP